MNRQMEPEDELKISVVPQSITVEKPVPAQNQAPENGRFAVMAPYWLNGLHNKDGLALAEKINRLIREKKLEEKEDAINTMLATFSDVRKFGIGVVSERQYLDDPHRKMNMAEPRSLLDGAFVRDKDGAYRPAAGGRTVLMDNGDSLTLKGGEKSLDAAVELAKAKGWTAISLTGKANVMEAAWISAQLAGIEVINYTPTPEAQAKLAERLAEQPAPNGLYEGKIMSVEGNQVVQKIGRDPDVVVRHNIANLSRVPGKNEVVGIVYKDGKGAVSSKEIEKAGQER